MRCPTCGSTKIIGKTSGMGPVQPWKCQGCHRLFWDRDLATAPTAPPGEAGELQVVQEAGNAIVRLYGPSSAGYMQWRNNANAAFIPLYAAPPTVQEKGETDATR